MRVALAGGTGGLGKYMVDAFVNRNRKDQVVILSRSTKAGNKEERTGVPIEAVDYTDVPSLTKTFDQLGIDTVVSVIASFDIGELESQQANLIDAGVASKFVKRFIPSAWAMDVDVEKPGGYKPKLFETMNTVTRKLQATDLEWTSVCNGMMMDYLLPAGPRHHAPWPIPIKFKEAKAIIPGTGDEPFTMTMTDDIASAVILLLDAPKGSWPTKTLVSGDNTTWNKIVALTEEATGTKFDVKRIPEEQLKSDVEDAKKRNDSFEIFAKELDLFGYAQSGIYVPKGSEIVEGVNYTKVKDVLALYGKN